MSFKRSVFSIVGMFDEKYRGHGDFFETDMCLQIGRAGFRVLYNPHAVVMHYPVEEKSGKLNRYRNNIYFYFKNLHSLSNFPRFMMYLISMIIFEVFLYGNIVKAIR